MSSRRAQLEALARDALGYAELRPGQATVAEAVLDGRDALAIMATGYGKSAIYQLAGLLNFGDATDGPCGHCDICEAGAAEAPAGGPFPVGARVEHPKWGAATVQRYEDDKLVVLFDAVGYKALSLDAVAENGLLKAI